MVEHRMESATIQMVVFRLGHEDYGVPIKQVEEIHPVLASEITHVPQAQYYVEGIVNFRGEVIPLVNMWKRFSLPEEVLDERCMIVAHIGKTVAGILVNEVEEVRSLSVKDISPAPAMVRGEQGAFIAGVGRGGERLLIILDLEKLFTAAELAEIGSVVM